MDTRQRDKEKEKEKEKDVPPGERTPKDRTWTVVKERCREDSSQGKMCGEWVIVDRCESRDRALHVTPAGVEVVEISDEEEADVVELSSEEYMRSMGYLIRVEESEDDIEPEVGRMLKRMHKEEKKLREEKFKVLRSGIKLEEG
ncbi:hypothetical protein Bca101_090353 [Brassica carinata]